MLMAAAPLAPPLQPAPLAVPVATTVGRRRASPAIAGPLAVLLVVAVVVVGAMFVAALPGGDAGSIAAASESPRPTRTPTPTARPTPTAHPTLRPTPTPTAAATPASRATPRPPGGTGDLCEPFLGFACGLGAGRYEPSVFTPAIRFALGDGWSTVLAEPDIMVLGRDQGMVTFASRLSAVYPSGDATAAPRSARALVETFVTTDGAAAGKPSERRIDKRKATVVDLAPTGPARLALFGTANEVYYLEPHGTTRILVIEGKDGLLVIAIEPAEGSTLEAILPAATSVVDSLRFR
jgi:hypothetical protein